MANVTQAGPAAQACSVQRGSTSSGADELEQRPALERLPDDVLLEVMQRLGAEDLLACRLVCRTLCRLALHRDAWRSKTLVCDRDEHRTCSLLRLAPCLRELQLYLSASENVCDHSVACATACEVTQVTMILESGSGLGYQASQLLIGLATPGRLKTVKVLLATALDRTEATMLFLAILRTPGPGLEEITIKGRNIRQPMLKPSPVYEGLRSSSLRTFFLNVEGVGEWAQLVLSAHGETLKKVVLATALVETEATAAPCNLTLQCLRSVQELTVRLDPRLLTLAEPASLQVLYLLVDGREAEEHFAAAGELFLRAANLREVAMLALPEKRLDVRAVLPGHCSLLVRGLVRARAQSLVTKLSLVPKISCEDSAELPWLLARTLRQVRPWLPALRQLSVGRWVWTAPQRVPALTSRPPRLCGSAP